MPWSETSRAGGEPDRGTREAQCHECHVLRNCVFWALLPSKRSLSQPPVPRLVARRPRHVFLTLTAWSGCSTKTIMNALLLFPSAPPLSPPAHHPHPNSVCVSCRASIRQSVCRSTTPLQIPYKSRLRLQTKALHLFLC